MDNYIILHGVSEGTPIFCRKSSIDSFRYVPGMNSTVVQIGNHTYGVDETPETIHKLITSD